MIRIFLSVLLFLALHSTGFSQRCATVVPESQSVEFEKWMRSKLNEPTILTVNEDTVYRIPVVVHVVHNGDSIGQSINISDEQIETQIEVLNEDFNRSNPDTIYTPEIFRPVAADPKIEFVLAYQDPEGNDTTGITRTYSTVSAYDPESDGDKLKLKSLIMWPPEDYLNIWVTNLDGKYLGHAQFPQSNHLDGLLPPYDAEMDGVIIDYYVFGSKKKIDSLDLWHGYDRGRTTTHEIGHFLGIRHIWGEDAVSCSDTDYCEDTPNQSVYNDLCPISEPFSCDTGI